MQETVLQKIDPVRLFSQYMHVTGVPSLVDESGPDPKLSGKRLGVINGASWISLWSTYFGKKYLPGVKIINIGNEAIQLRFMSAFNEGNKCPPYENIELFCRYAKELFDLAKVNAILISCSTMNRAFTKVSQKMSKFNIPVIQIDQPMMEKAIGLGKRILVIATHGPTMENTSRLLEETAFHTKKEIEITGVLIKDAFDMLGKGKILKHNLCIAEQIRKVKSQKEIDVVVLAQFSMSVFTFTFPDPKKEFGINVLDSAKAGFQRVAEVLRE